MLETMTDIADQLGDMMLADAQADAPANPELAPEPQANPEPQADPQPAAIEPERPEAGHIPIQALLDEREKRQQAQQRAEAYERQLQQLQAQQPPAAVPDLYDDPEAFAQHIQQQQANAIWEARRDMSAGFAVSQFGKETLDAAIAWASQKNDPYLHQRFLASRDPYREVIVPEFQRDQLLSQVSADPTAWARQHLAALEGGSAQQQPAAQAAKPPSVSPPRSLAAAAGSGGIAHTPAGAGFDDMKFALDK